MIKKLFFLALILSTHLAFAVEPEPLRFAADYKDLDLSVKLLQQTLSQKTDNVVVSPLSIYMATDLLANGAQGRSLEELQVNILNSPTNNSLQNINEHLDNYLKNVSGAININNSIWGDDFSEDYIETVAQKLHSDALPRPESTSTINQWVKEKTNGLITNALDEELTEEGALYLINTVYFKDDWKHQFSPRNTSQKYFYSLNADKPDKVSMMYSKRDVDYFENDTLQAIRLPYVNGDVMQIFLPKKDIDFIDFIKNLKAEDLDLTYQKQEVEIYLPRFEINYKIDNMKNMYENFGVKEVFDKNFANLSALSPSSHYVEKIIHQANIRLDEKGTVASAVTATEMHLLGDEIWHKIQTFIADHPFIFMINNGLFIGAYTQGTMLIPGFDIRPCHLDSNTESITKKYDCMINQADNLNMTDLKKCLLKNKEKSDSLENIVPKICKNDWFMDMDSINERGLKECLFILNNPSVDEKDFIYDADDYVIGKIKNTEEKQEIVLGTEHFTQTIGEINNNQIIFNQWNSRKYTGKIDENGKIIITKICPEDTFKQEQKQKQTKSQQQLLNMLQNAIEKQEQEGNQTEELKKIKQIIEQQLPNNSAL